MEFICVIFPKPRKISFSITFWIIHNELLDTTKVAKSWPLDVRTPWIELLIVFFAKRWVCEMSEKHNSHGSSGGALGVCGLSCGSCRRLPSQIPIVFSTKHIFCISGLFIMFSRNHNEQLRQSGPLWELWGGQQPSGSSRTSQCSIVV